MERSVAFVHLPTLPDDRSYDPEGLSRCIPRDIDVSLLPICSVIPGSTSTIVLGVVIDRPHRLPRCSTEVAALFSQQQNFRQIYQGSSLAQVASRIASAILSTQ